MTINHKDFKKCSIEYFDAAFYYFLSTYLGKRKFYKNFQKKTFQYLSLYVKIWLHDSNETVTKRGRRKNCSAQLILPIK